MVIERLSKLTTSDGQARDVMSMSSEVLHRSDKGRGHCAGACGCQEGVDNHRDFAAVWMYDAPRPAKARGIQDSALWLVVRDISKLNRILVQQCVKVVAGGITIQLF